MRTLGDVLAGASSRKPSGRTFRRDARFIRDVSVTCTPLDRNGRARLLVQAEGLERRSKLPGKRCGLLGLSGLAVLRALVLGFQHSKTGLCCPSIETIRRKTGLCKQTIVKALRALEAVGLLIVTRRLVRRVVERFGVPMLTTVQGSNLYGFRLDAVVPITAWPTGWATSKPRSFPKPNALAALLFQPMLSNRRDLQQPANQPIEQPAGERRKWLSMK